VRCALDNGAWGCWKRGLPFDEGAFLKAIEGAHRWGLSVDFIVAPDIVAGGRASLGFSVGWAYGQLLTAPRLALAVQDGMLPQDLTPYHLERFTHIFVGGTMAWKLATAQMWVEFAHDVGKQAHIGGVGTRDRIRWAREIGADSVDSTTLSRNQNWDEMREAVLGADLFNDRGEGGVAAVYPARRAGRGDPLSANVHRAAVADAVAVAGGQEHTEDSPDRRGFVCSSQRVSGGIG